MNKKKLPVGISDFKRIILDNYYYVDKTLLIKEIINKSDTILLIPRPRRFGKTLNLSMLRYFYDCCPETERIDVNKQAAPLNTYSDLFVSLDIQGAGSEYMDKQGKYPVIFLSFRNIKDCDWETCLSKIKQLIQEEYNRHYYLLSCRELVDNEKDYFKRIIDLKGDKGDYENSLEKLLKFLSRYYGERAVILIDEYDVPIHTGFNYGYYEQIINFIRNFLSGGLKDTDQYLEKSVLTGIMRIAKESIFSGLNNFGVFTLTDSEFNDKFGFTESEVETILKDFELFHRCDEIREWYNGYRFGEKVIYNPWSIINFFSSDAKSCRPYWINTSDNQIVDTLLSKGGKELKEELEQLIRGESIEKRIDENIVLKDIFNREELLWSFLLLGGYLKQTQKRRDAFSGEMYYTLSVPNKEVRVTYTQIVEQYFSTKIGNEKLEVMLQALIDGDILLFEKMLRKVVLSVFSYHDFSDEPEKVYHALVAGLLVWISNTHEIKSNRESGFGRYDISIIPRDTGKTGYVIEFKAVDVDSGETVASAIKKAGEQIEEKKYETELIAKGISRIKKLAIVFQGKDVHVKDL